MPIQEFFAPGGPLAQQFDRYEARPEQVTMAQAVSKAMAEGTNLLVEAGTGVGKSLGYLAPALDIIKDNRRVSTTDLDDLEGDGETTTERPRRIVVSTNSIQLQRQLFDKELPLLKKIFPWLTYSMAVGSENYLCGARLAKAISEAGTNPLLGADPGELDALDRWSRETASGLRMDLPMPVSATTWALVNRQSDLCRCRKWDPAIPCFYRKARAEMNQAHVILVNHHLLMAHLTIEQGAVIPPFDYLAIDEIHSLEDVATQCFGIEISNYKIDRMIKDTQRTLRSAGTEVMRSDEIREFLDMIGKSSDALFYMIRQRLDQERKDTLRLRQPLITSIENVQLMEHLSKVARMLEQAADEIVDPQKAHEVRAISNRANTISEQMGEWLLQKNQDHVYQIASENGGKRLVAKSNPVDVSPYLKQALWDMDYPVIGASATISTNGTMEFVKKKLGAEDAAEVVLASPFDYVQNAMIYVAGDLPEPPFGSKDPTYDERMTERIAQLIRVSQGRALVLFTANYTMKNTGQRLRLLLPDFKIMIQGEDLERHRMVEELRANPKSVICGSASFFHGVDIAGDALQMVIITKMPFPNVGDPLFEAKCERIDAAGGRGKPSFMKLSLPEAIIKLKQGFGRLIRTSTDWGVVAILDTRVITKPYGKLVLGSLPRTYIKYQVQEVADFFRHRTPPPPDNTPVVEDPIEEVPF